MGRREGSGRNDRRRSGEEGVGSAVGGEAFGESSEQMGQSAKGKEGRKKKEQRTHYDFLKQAGLESRYVWK